MTGKRNYACCSLNMSPPLLNVVGGLIVIGQWIFISIRLPGTPVTKGLVPTGDDGPAV